MRLSTPFTNGELSLYLNVMISPKNAVVLSILLGFSVVMIVATFSSFGYGKQHTMESSSPSEYYQRFNFDPEQLTLEPARDFGSQQMIIVTTISPIIKNGKVVVSSKDFLERLFNARKERYKSYDNRPEVYGLSHLAVPSSFEVNEKKELFFKRSEDGFLEVLIDCDELHQARIESSRCTLLAHIEEVRIRISLPRVHLSHWMRIVEESKNFIKNIGKVDDANTDGRGHVLPTVFEPICGADCVHRF